MTDDDPPRPMTEAEYIRGVFDHIADLVDAKVERAGGRLRPVSALDLLSGGDLLSPRDPSSVSLAVSGQRGASTGSASAQVTGAGEGGRAGDEKSPLARDNV